MCRTLVAATAASAVLLAPGHAAGALFFVFKPTSAVPGERVELRTPWTPAGFSPRRTAKPLGRPVTLYLVRNEVASLVRTHSDPRVSRIGSVRLDRKSRGVTRFTVPRLEPGPYAIAYSCPDCAAYSFGRTFFSGAVGPDTSPRYRDRLLLTIR